MSIRQKLNVLALIQQLMKLYVVSNISVEECYIYSNNLSTTANNTDGHSKGKHCQYIQVKYFKRTCCYAT